MYSLIIYNQRTKDYFDVSSLASDIEYTTSIMSQAGKLTFLLEKDPNNILNLCEGNVVFFTDKNEKTGEEIKIFKGYIFILGTDGTEAYRVTAYDQLRYLKNKDSMTVSGVDDGPETVIDVFNKICDRNGVPMENRNTSLFTCDYKLTPKLYNNVSYFEILDKSIQETLQYSDKNYYFFIEDKFGVLTLNEISKCKTDFIIGDDSLLTDYKYELSIDSDTFNRIKVMRKDKEKGLTIDKIVQDEKSITEIGVLQQLMDAGNMIENQVNLYSNLYLKMKNRPTKTIQIEALGVTGLNAGYGFKLVLNKLGLIDGVDMFILSATHKFDDNVHTMQLDVSGIPQEEIVPVEHKQILYDIVNGDYKNGRKERIKALMKKGYSKEEAEEIQEEINQLYNFKDEVVQGKWEGHIKKDGKGSWDIDNKLQSDLRELGVDVDLLNFVLDSTAFY